MTREEFIKKYHANEFSRDDGVGYIFWVLSYDKESTSAEMCNDFLSIPGVKESSPMAHKRAVEILEEKKGA